MLIPSIVLVIVTLMMFACYACVRAAANIGCTLDEASTGLYFRFLHLAVAAAAIAYILLQMRYAMPSFMAWFEANYPFRLASILLSGTFGMWRAFTDERASREEGMIVGRSYE